MRSKKFVNGRRLRNGMAAMVAALLIAWPGVSQRAAAQTPTVLHTFTGPDGINPILGVTFDSTGNLFGVASGGGSSNNGTVYELMPANNGSWTERTLYSFNGTSGSTPVSPVVFDSKGNLYGATKLGGSNGMGVVYELSPSGAGKWTQTVLHNFGGTGDGSYPVGTIVVDSTGDIFGTTEGGGAYGDGTEIQGGTVFEVSPAAGGGWKESILHSFGNGSDGNLPKGGVILDTKGNAYGTTYKGGAHGQGAVFELSPSGQGAYTETVIHNFNTGRSQGDAANPATGLTFDSAGNLYGGSTSGFDSAIFEGGGTLYKLVPQSGGTWKESVIVSLGFDEFLEAIYSNLVLDSAGHIFGVTLDSSASSVFEIQGSNYKYISVFTGAKVGTRLAVGSLWMDSAGNLYGAAQAGGAHNDGVVFEIKR
jgi:uncharacterized repeat protein (TIGR03803 family)